MENLEYMKKNIIKTNWENLEPSILDLDQGIRIVKPQKKVILAKTKQKIRYFKNNTF